MKFKLILFAVTAALLTSCASPRLTEENRDVALRKAQDYIFDNVKNISQDNRKIIMYTYPKILKEEIFLTMGQEFNQYYFAWDLKHPKVTIMVFGTSKKDFADWIPRRILFEEYTDESYGSEITESKGVWADKPTYTDTALNTNRDSQ